MKGVKTIIFKEEHDGHGLVKFLTIPASNHQFGLKPRVEVYQDNKLVNVVLEINELGDVTIGFKGNILNTEIKVDIIDG